MQPNGGGCVSVLVQVCPCRSLRRPDASENPQARGGGRGRAGRGKGGGFGPFLPLRPPTRFRVVFITFENAQFFGPGRGRREGGEREQVSSRNPQHPQPSPSHPPQASDGSPPPLAPSPPRGPPVVFGLLRRGSGAALGRSRVWEGATCRPPRPARLTWPSLRWGRRPRLPGRPQLRPFPRGPGPSGRALHSLSSSAPCGPGNSPGFWPRLRWRRDRPAGCLECRRPAWSTRSPGGGAGGTRGVTGLRPREGRGRSRALGDRDEGDARVRSAEMGAAGLEKD